MTEMRKFGLVDFLALVLVLGLALAARALYLRVWADSSKKDGPVRVQELSPELRDLPPGTHMFGRSTVREDTPPSEQNLPPTETEALIHNLGEYGWFGSLAPFAHRDEKTGLVTEEQTAHAAPGYPWLVYGIWKVVGYDRVLSSVRCFQALLGSLTAALYFFFARRAFRSLSVATVAGVLVAVHPYFVANCADLEDGVVATFMLAVTLVLGCRAVQTSGPFASLLFGLTLAGLTLVRASMLPFAFVALIWFLLRSRSLGRGWLCALLAFLGFANGLAPWTVRNIMTKDIGEPVPIVDSAYYHLWIGNNPEATGGPVTPEMLETAPTDELRKIAKQPERYNKLGALVAHEIRQHPAETLMRRLRALLYFVVGERFVTEGKLALTDWKRTAPDISTEDEQQSERTARIALAATLLLMLLLGFLGWRWSYGWRAESLPASLAIIWVPLPFLLSHAGGLSGPRLPLDGILLTYAAFALCCLLPKIGRNLLDARVEEEPAAEQPG